MHSHPFIFSDEPKYRLQRHVCFWLIWWLFQGFLYSFLAINSNQGYWIRLPASLVESLIFLSAHMFLSYSLMYFVIPRYLIKQHYMATAIWVVLCCLLTAMISAGLALTIVPPVRICLMGQEYATQFRTPTVNIYLALMAGLRGALTVGGIAAAIKLMKYWYLKEQRNLQLQKENIESQLQLLKAQVHPHFLFNTLNNIYSYTQNTSAIASKLVIGLSDMLRYMLYECNQPMVPLSKEIKMLRDYCSLEKVRYDKHLDLQVTVQGESSELLIAPLLLLPFVENSFKHGASDMLEEAWVSLTLNIEGDQLKMKLINSKPVQKSHPSGNTTNAGIGINNVQTRLKLLYENKYDLVITSEEAVFIVNLSLQLEKRPISTVAEPGIRRTIYAES